MTEAAPEPPPGKIALLDFRLAPSLSWDGFVCENGEQVGAALQRFGELCDTYWTAADNPIPYGCFREAEVVAETGHVYTLRAVNRTDLYDCTAYYQWVFVDPAPARSETCWLCAETFAS